MSPHAAPPGGIYDPILEPIWAATKTALFIGPSLKVIDSSSPIDVSAGLIDVSLGDFARSVSHFRGGECLANGKMSHFRHRDLLIYFLYVERRVSRRVRFEVRNAICAKFNEIVKILIRHCFGN